MVESVRRTRYFAGVSRNTVLLAFASLFADISSEMLYPVLPIMLTQTMHASGSIVGSDPNMPLVVIYAQLPD